MAPPRGWVSTIEFYAVFWSILILSVIFMGIVTALIEVAVVVFQEAAAKAMKTSQTKIAQWAALFATPGGSQEKGGFPGSLGPLGVSPCRVHL